MGLPKKPETFAKLYKTGNFVISANRSRAEAALCRVAKAEAGI
jgi:hypothetical protein